MFSYSALSVGIRPGVLQYDMAYILKATSVISDCDFFVLLNIVNYDNLSLGNLLAVVYF